jgi:mono/diheme cytochrome c family protein
MIEMNLPFGISATMRTLCPRLILLIAQLAVAPVSVLPAMAAEPRGETLAQRWCSECHAVKAGQTSPNPKAPPFAAIAAEPSATDYGLHVFLKTTHATMPNFKINADDIDDLVAYIRSLRPQPQGQPRN